MTGGQPGINGCLATDATPAPHARRRTERVVEGERSSGTALSRNLLVGVNGEKTPPGGCQGSAASLRATSGACRIGDVSSPTPRGRPQAAEGRGQRADVHGQWADVHGQRADVHGQWADVTDNRLMSMDNRLLAADNRLMSTDNGLMSMDNGLMSTDNGLLAAYAR